MTNQDELRTALGPIDTPKKALAMVALLHVIAYEEDLAAGRTETKVKQPEPSIKSTLELFDVATFDGGFIVRVPLGHWCPVSVNRVPFRVTTKGDVCFAGERAVLVDAGSGMCVD